MSIERKLSQQEKQGGLTPFINKPEAKVKNIYSGQAFDDLDPLSHVRRGFLRMTDWF